MTRVAVIGGGIAGVTAALDCAGAGADVTLLEARGRLGGAAYSFVRDGLHVDNGQHVFLRCCTEYVALLSRIGAGDLVRIQSQLSIPVLAQGRRPAWLQRTNLPAPLHLASAMLGYPLLSVRERLSVARAMQALGRIDPDDPAADRRSFGEWLAARHQGRAAISAVWELIGLPTLNLRVGDASLAQAAYVFQEGLLRDRDAGDIGYATAPLGEVHDVRARAALAVAGVTVRRRSAALAVDRGTDGFMVAVSGAPTLTADAVVIAVPQDRAERLIPAAARVDTRAISALGSSPIVNVHLVFDRQVTGLAFAATVDSPVQWLFDRTRVSGLRRGQYLALSISAADAELHMPAAQLRDRLVPALAAVLPGARAAEVVRAFVTREHAATFRGAPGSRALRPPAQTAMPGLALAGAWTDTGWPATMEGAVRSGHAAARVVLAHTRRAPARGEAVPA